MGTERQRKSVTFPCIAVKQPIGEFYVGVMPFRALCDVAFFDVRRVLQEDRDVERYLGIQRPLSNRRVADLKEYVRVFDATFPTSIIIAVKQRCAFYDPAEGRMMFAESIDQQGEEDIQFGNIARVIDGQHRIAGLYDYDGEEFDLVVSIFVGIDIADQAQIFSTVNLQQTKVNKSLAYDLFALAKTRSPQKTCHNVAVALDQDEASPFHRRIKRLGVATEGRERETITQATFVEALMPYLSRDARRDRDVLLRGGSLKKATDVELNMMPLRNLFIEEKDIEIAELVFNYFEAIKRRWPVAWDRMERGYMLNKTNGFRALMRLFRDVYARLATPGQIVEIERFEHVFSMSSLRDDDFNTEKFVPGNTGQSDMYHALAEEILPAM